MSHLDKAIEILQEECVDDLVWDLKASIFQLLIDNKYYPEDAEGPDHEEELQAIMKRLVEEHTG